MMPMNNYRIRNLYLGVLICSGLVCSFSLEAAFTFNSNGTGVDGVWALDASDCPSANTPIELDVGSSGIKQFSSVSIHQNCLVSFTPSGGDYDSFSNPVRLVVTGDVQINGTLDLDGEDGLVSTGTSSVAGGQGGPGGYDGGHSGLAVSDNDTNGGSGYGPGGGHGADVVVRTSSDDYCSVNAGNGQFKPVTNSIRNQLLIGGSGGGGGCKNNGNSYSAGSGGGGGGAIQIASSGTITVNGVITAQGGTGGDGWSSSGDAGDGSAGMIHLIANRIEGSGTVNAGRIITETLDYRGELSSNESISQIEFQRLDHSLVPAAQIQISQIDGQTISSGTPLVLNETGEVTLEITSSGLSEGTTIEVSVVNERLRDKSTASTTLDVYGSGSVTMTLESGVMSILAYVVEGS